MFFVSETNKQGVHHMRVSFFSFVLPEFMTALYLFLFCCVFADKHVGPLKDAIAIHKKKDLSGLELKQPVNCSLRYNCNVEQGVQHSRP